MSKILVILSIPFAVILTLLSFSSNLFASDLFFDDFSDPTTYTRWTTFGTAGAPSWQIINGEYGIKIDGNFIVSNTYPIDNVWNSNWENYDLQVDLRGVHGTDKNLAFRYVDSQNFYEIHHSGGIVHLDKHFNGNTTGLSSYAYELSNGIVYHLEIKVLAGHINVKIDNNQIFDLDDINNPILQGRIALRAGTGAVAPTEVWFDNLVVSNVPNPTPTPIPLPNLDVSDIKQYSLPWGDQIYDNATSWSSSPTISRWGCALTSADMILKYHGFNVNPGELNDWLIGQPDGYLRNGYLNWLAISRYSKTHMNFGQKALEFSKLPGDSDKLIEQLKLNQPAILELPGHFVVAKSQTADSFGINDPAYNNRPTLSSYGNSFISLESFKPSSTNLSYIMLVIDPQFDVTVTDSNGQEIGESYIQNPFDDDFDGLSVNGNPVKILLKQYPESGNYTVHINGNGNYALDSYLYDIDGNLTSSSLGGIVDDGHSDEYEMVIGSNNSIKRNVSVNSIIKDWLSLNLPSRNIITLLNNSMKHASKGNKVAAKSNLDGAISYLQENALVIGLSASEVLQSEIQEYSDSI